MAVTLLCKNTLYGLPELQQGLFLLSSWQSSHRGGGRKKDQENNLGEKLQQNYSSSHVYHVGDFPL